jgi:hypothetical protein
MGRSGPTSTLVTCWQFRHSNASKPGSSLRGGMLTTSPMEAPHRGHDNRTGSYRSATLDTNISAPLSSPPGRQPTSPPSSRSTPPLAQPVQESSAFSPLLHGFRLALRSCSRCDAHHRDAPGQHMAWRERGRPSGRPLCLEAVPDLFGRRPDFCEAQCYLADRRGKGGRVV